MSKTRPDWPISFQNPAERFPGHHWPKAGRLGLAVLAVAPNGAPGANPDACAARSAVAVLLDLVLGADVCGRKRAERVDAVGREAGMFGGAPFSVRKFMTASR